MMRNKIDPSLVNEAYDGDYTCAEDTGLTLDIFETTIFTLYFQGKVCVNITAKDGVFDVELMEGATMTEGARAFFEGMNAMIPDLMDQLGYVKKDE